MSVQVDGQRLVISPSYYSIKSAVADYEASGSERVSLDAVASGIAALMEPLGNSFFLNFFVTLVYMQSRAIPVGRSLPSCRLSTTKAQCWNATRQLHLRNSFTGRKPVIQPSKSLYGKSYAVMGVNFAVFRVN